VSKKEERKIGPCLYCEQNDSLAAEARERWEGGVRWEDSGRACKSLVGEEKNGPLYPFFRDGVYK